MCVSAERGVGREAHVDAAAMDGVAPRHVHLARRRARDIQPQPGVAAEFVRPEAPSARGRPERLGADGVDLVVADSSRRGREVDRLALADRGRGVENDDLYLWAGGEVARVMRPGVESQ